MSHEEAITSPRSRLPPPPRDTQLPDIGTLGTPPPSRNHIPLMELPTMSTASIACARTLRAPRSSTTAATSSAFPTDKVSHVPPHVHRPSVHAFRHQTNGSHVIRRSSTTALTASILANLAVPVTCKSRILARPESSLTGFELSVRHTCPQTTTRRPPDRRRPTLHDPVPRQMLGVAWTNSPLSAVIWCTRSCRIGVEGVGDAVRVDCAYGLVTTAPASTSFARIFRALKSPPRSHL
jgi:hypothetical protein